MGLEISEQQICQFKTDGYLVLPSVFDLSEVKAMREEANFILELMVNSSLYHQRKSGRLDIRQTHTGQIVRKIQPINDLSLCLSRLSTEQRLLVPLAQLMADQPILNVLSLCFGSQFQIKYLGSTSAVDDIQSLPSAV